MPRLMISLIRLINLSDRKKQQTKQNKGFVYFCLFEFVWYGSIRRGMCVDSESDFFLQNDQKSCLLACVLMKMGLKLYNVGLRNNITFIFWRFRSTSSVCCENVPASTTSRRRWWAWCRRSHAWSWGGSWRPHGLSRRHPA